MNTVVVRRRNPLHVQLQPDPTDAKAVTKYQTEQEARQTREAEQARTIKHTMTYEQRKALYAASRRKERRR